MNPATNLDAILNHIRTAEPDAAAADAAVSRVRARIFDAAHNGAPGTLRSCADFQALIPEHLAGTLSEARELLLSDHARDCVLCRRAMNAARSGKVAVISRPRTVSSAMPSTARWAIAACGLLAMALGTWAIVRNLPSSGTRATVENVSGMLYAVSTTGSTPVFSGRDISDSEILRTAKGAGASFKLTDGSIVELNERSQVSFTRNARGLDIRLEGGGIIVQAAKQRNGALYVTTPDCTVWVKGTVFAVNRGVKGSRVSVAEGTVHVEENGRTAVLQRGGQTASSPSIARVPVQDDFAWSRNASKYIALLGDLRAIQKGLEQVPAPAPRFDSKLLDRLPEDVVLFASMPNAGPMIGEAARLFHERLDQSQVLRDWWEQQHAPDIDGVLNNVRTAAGYLGNEIVLYVRARPDGSYSAPVLVAETVRPGLADYFAGVVPHASSPDAPQLIVRDNLAAFSPDKDALTALFDPDTPRFRGGFNEMIRSSFNSGASWLLCANLEQIRANGVRGHMHVPSPAAEMSGVDSLRYLIFQRKEIAGQTDNSLALQFDQRTGLAGLLAAPGPMGAVDFISPKATLAASFALHNPYDFVHQMLAAAPMNDTQMKDANDNWRLIDALARPLGADAAFALDGPLFPVPNWVLAAETYDPGRLQLAIQNAANQMKLQLTPESINGRQYFAITMPNSSLEAHFTFYDGYLVMAATSGGVTRAIQNKQNGYSLTRSDQFHALLPRDENTGMSGFVYHNLGPLTGFIADELKSSPNLSPGVRETLDTVDRSSAPGLVYAYAEPDRIVISAHGSLLGFNVDSMALPMLLQRAVGQQRALARHP